MQKEDKNPVSFPVLLVFLNKTHIFESIQKAGRINPAGSYLKFAAFSGKAAGIDSRTAPG